MLGVYSLNNYLFKEQIIFHIGFSYVVNMYPSGLIENMLALFSLSNVISQTKILPPKLTTKMHQHPRGKTYQLHGYLFEGH